MAFAFFDAENLESIPAGELPNVLDYSYCFANCKNLDINKNKIILPSNIVNAAYMFMNSGISGDLRIYSGLILPKFIKDVKGMFLNCAEIEYIPLNFLKYAINITDLSDLFSNCTSLHGVDDTFVIPSKVNSLNRTFKNCTLLEYNYMQFVNPNNILTMGETFAGCTILENISNNFKLSCNITDLHRSFL